MILTATSIIEVSVCQANLVYLIWKQKNIPKKQAYNHHYLQFQISQKIKISILEMTKLGLTGTKIPHHST